MNIWIDWIAPAVAVLAVIVAVAAVVVAARYRDAAAASAQRSMVAAHGAHEHAQRARALIDEGRGERHLAAATVVHMLLPPRHDPPRIGALPAACTAGHHPWARRDVTNVRRPAGGTAEQLLCSVTWHCAECPATRHEQNVPPPLTLAVAQSALTPTGAAPTAAASEPEVTAS